MYRDIAHAVYKRGEAQFEGYELPSWSIWLVVLDIIIFVPMILVVHYTFQIFPKLAMIEDPSPPAYEPVSLNDDNQSLAEEPVPKLVNERADGSGAETRAVTASLRATLRTLKNISGWISLFRGLGCYLAMTVGVTAVGFSLASFLPAIIAIPIAGVLALQLYTTWIHIIVSAPSAKTFWQRIPPFKTTFKATALPIALVFVAAELSKLLPALLARGLGMSTSWDVSEPGKVPQADPADVWKGLLVFLTSVLLQIFVAIPAQVVLTRVQASILPEEDETIVPFDRSFQGKLEPAIVGGKGYVTIKDAWATFSRASWVRLVKMYVKLFAVSVGVGFVWAAIIIPEAIIVARYTKKID